MNKVLAIITNPSVRRLLVFLLSIGTVLLHRKWGLELNAEEIVGVIVMALGYMGQSAVKEASMAKTDALAAVALNPPAPANPPPPQP